VLAHESRRAAEKESARQTTMLMEEIEAHQRTDAALQKAKEVAEAANVAKTRYLVGISHEIRTPLNSIFGYAQLMERNAGIRRRRTRAGHPPQRRASVEPDRRAARHLPHRKRPAAAEPRQGAAGRFPGSAGRHVPPAGRREGHRLPATTGRPHLPLYVHTDQKRLRQILINLLSNAIKYTEAGHASLIVRYRSQVAEFESVGHRHRHPSSKTSSGSSSPSSAVAIRRCGRFRAPAWD
jgi:signal transduction histidine kinase